MAREINAELLDTKIEKAQQDLVKAKHRYDAAAATEYSCAVTPQVRQTGNRLSGLAGTAYASLLA